MTVKKKKESQVGWVVVETRGRCLWPLVPAVPATTLLEWYGNDNGGIVAA